MDVASQAPSMGEKELVTDERVTKEMFRVLLRKNERLEAEKRAWQEREASRSDLLQHLDFASRRDKLIAVQWEEIQSYRQRLLEREAVHRQTVTAHWREGQRNKKKYESLSRIVKSCPSCKQKVMAKRMQLKQKRARQRATEDNS